MKQEISCRLLTKTAQLPSRAHADDAGFDLHADEATRLAPGERALVSTGVSLDLGTLFAWVVPRSGLAAKHGLTIVNSPGLIDPGYRGEIKVVLLNTDQQNPFEVEPGMRIAQLVFGRPLPVELKAVEGALSGSARGSSGFGSSG